MARVFITGSSDGLGLMAGKLLIEQGHEVVLHGRNEARSRDALTKAPGARASVSGDLSTLAGMASVADEVNRPLRRRDPQCWDRLSRAATRRDRAAQRLRRQCSGALCADRSDPKAGPVDLSELRHASRRAAANG